jgi:mono/diheme cytochrome c family protein
MKFTLKLVLVVLVVLSLALVAFAQKGDVKKGEALFATKCKTCHGPKGEGVPAIEKMFGVKMLALGSKEVQAISDADLEKVLKDGKGKMKPVTLNATEMTDVLAFMRTLK